LKRKESYMPLTLCSMGEMMTVRKIGGSQEVRQHLIELGFTEGSDITVISDIGGNLIVKVKDSRIALDKSMATKILV
jgi:ferrous iron transport protein A